MREILEKIGTDIAVTASQSFVLALTAAAIFTLIVLCFAKSKEKISVKGRLCRFITVPFYRRMFLLAFYTVMILFRTLLNREELMDPLGNIMGGWSMYSPKGTLTAESAENVLLFIPFTFLLLWTAAHRIAEKRRLITIICKSTAIAFLFSLGIESTQTLFRIGTFQFADLFYNTLGGAVGGFIYYILYKTVHIIKISPKPLKK